MVNIGKIIEDEFNASGLQISYFAQKINTSKRNVYNIFRRKSIDTNLLFKISEILNKDFFEIYSEKLTISKKEISIIGERREGYNNKSGVKKIVQLEIELTEEEYQNLLKKYKM